MEQIIDILRTAYPDRLIVAICKTKNEVYAKIALGKTFEPFDVLLNVKIDVQNGSIKEMSFMDMPDKYDSVEYIDVDNPYKEA